MNLVEIITNLLTAPGRASYELPRGLWLVYYPPTDTQPAHRLVIGRYAAMPSIVEQRVVHDTLLDALDRHPSRVVTDIDSTWSETTRGDWYGVQLSWHMLPTTDAFSPNPDRAQRVRLALEQRQRRLEKRRAKPAKPAGNRKPMLGRGGEE